MTQIPYGYRIEKGKIVVDSEAAGKISSFIENYLNGLSVKEANRTTQIPLSESALNHLLKNKIYHGTDIYPPLITAEVFHFVQEERAKRTHPATTTAADPVPEKKKFVFIVDDQHTLIAGDAGAAEAVSLLYSMIKPAADGRETSTSAEAGEMRRMADRIFQINAQHTADERSYTWE